MENFYSLLKVENTASEKEIKEALKREFQLWRHRTNAPSLERRQEAEKIVKSLDEAENILLDKTKRTEYDKQLQTATHEQPVNLELESGQDLLKKAEEFLMQDRLDEARDAATKATEKNGENHETWALLAWIKGRLGKLNDARYELERVIEKCPDNPDYYWRLGSVYEEMGMEKEATSNYEKAAQLYEKEAWKQPDNSEIQRTAIDLLIGVGMYTQAISLLEQSLSKEPNDEYFNWRLAIAYYQIAIEDWVPGAVRSLFQHGLFFQWFGPHAELLCVSKESAKQSIEYFKKALALNFEDRKLSTFQKLIYPQLTPLTFKSLIKFIWFWRSYLFVNTQKKQIKKDLKKAKWCLRKHSKNPWHTILVGIIGIVLTPLYGVGILAIVLWYFAGMKPGWKINRELADLK